MRERRINTHILPSPMWVCGERAKRVARVSRERGGRTAVELNTDWRSPDSSIRIGSVRSNR